MSTLRFDGVKCGMHGRTESGDVNQAVNTMLVCQCEADLGPLARFIATKGDDLGRHHVCCRLCNYVTILSNDGSILKVAPMADFQAIIANRDLVKAVQEKA